ncbi:hypothetical protein LSAT2_016842, partial [Lamellibrachia satsuma]
RTQLRLIKADQLRPATGTRVTPSSRTSVNDDNDPTRSRSRRLDVHGGVYMLQPTVQ